MEIKDYGYISDGGKKVYLKGFINYTADKITDEEYAALDADYDDIEAPPGQYKVQPENQGKIIWLMGSPGTGKSTTGQLLGRHHGYVYYEADSFAMLKNPFNDLSADNPTMNQVKMKFLKGKGAKERAQLMKSCEKLWQQVMAGAEYDVQELNKYYIALAEDIKKNKERIGGDWAIAHVILNDSARAEMRLV